MVSEQQRRHEDERALAFQSAVEILQAYEVSDIFFSDVTWLGMYSLSIPAIRRPCRKNLYDPAWASEPADRALQKELAGEHYLRPLHLTAFYDGAFSWPLGTVPGMLWGADRYDERLRITLPAAVRSVWCSDTWQWDASTSRGDVRWKASGQIAAGGFLPTPRPPNHAHAFAEYCRAANLIPLEDALWEHEI